MTTTPEYDRLKHDDKDGYDLNKLSPSTQQAAKSAEVSDDGLIFKLECFIDHATGGKLSKSSWALATLKAAHDEHLSSTVNEAVSEALAAKSAAASDLHAPMPTLATIDDEASNGFRVVLHFATEGEADDAHSFYLVAARRAAAKSAAPAAVGLTDDQWIDLAGRHANRDWNSDEPDGYLEAIQAVCRDFAAQISALNSSPSAPDAIGVAEAADGDAFREAIEGFLTAQDALANREYMGINAEPHDVLMRRVKEARRDLDAALFMKSGDRRAKDAARYRWLRQRHWDDSNMCVVVDPKNFVRLGSYCPSGNLLDDHIDSAMRGEQP
jgi:hypothetical protein